MLKKSPELCIKDYNIKSCLPEITTKLFQNNDK